MLIGDIMDKIKKSKIKYALIYITFCFFMILVFENKVNFYSDELLSYGLSNDAGGMYMAIEDGNTYFPSNTPWITHFSVDPGERFRYDIVWQNQSRDVHPPMYYLILHTICSFIPNAFSIWFAAVINILFALGVLFFLGQLVFTLTQDEGARTLVSIAFICSAGILSSVAFLRMYIMAMFWTIALAYVVVKRIGLKNDFKGWLAIFVCTAGGALTHYYCIIYAVFLSIFYGCYLIYKKQWKETAFFCLTQGMAAGVSICVFPSIVKHIFFSTRGVESFDNMAEEGLSDSFVRIKEFWHLIDTELFGGLLLCIICVFILFSIKDGGWRLHKTLRYADKTTLIRYLSIICPCVLYFLLVSRIAVYIQDRYMFPIYGVLFAVIISGISLWCRKIMKAQYMYMLVWILVIITVVGWKDGTLDYLCKSTEPLLASAAKHSYADCVYVYDDNYRINASYKEVSNYNSVTFYKLNDLDMLSTSDLSTRYELVLTTMLEDEEVLDRVLELCPYLNAYDYLGRWGYTDTYCLYYKPANLDTRG